MAGRVKKWFYVVLFPVVFLVLLIGFLPLLVEELLLPLVLARADLPGYEISISHISLTGCSLHVAGRPQFPVPVVAGNIRIDWTPAGLLHRRIEKISSSGLQVNLVDLPAVKKPSPVKSDRNEVPTEHRFLPIVIDQIEFHNGALFFPVEKRIVYLPFAFSARRLTGADESAGPAGEVNFQVRMEAAKHIVNAAVTIDPSLGRVSGRLESDFDLASPTLFMVFFSVPMEQLKGTARLTMAADAQIAPFSLGSVQAALVFADLMATGNGLRVGSLESQPARIEVSGSGRQFQVNGTGFQLLNPLRTGLGVAARISFLKNSLEWQGTLDLKPEADSVLGGRFMAKNVAPVRIGFEGAAGEGEASVHLATVRPEESSVDSAVVFRLNDVATTVAGIDFDARITFGSQPGSDTFAGTLSLHGHDGTVKSPWGFLNVPKFVVQAQGAFSPSQDGPAITARLTVEDASLDREQVHLRVQGMRLELPVAWPSAGTSAKGGLWINTILMGGKNLGSFNAGIVQDEKELKVDGLLKTPLFPEEKISLAGIVRLPDQKKNIVELSFALQNSKAASSNFVPFFPALQGIEGTGNLAVSANLAFSPCGLSGQADFSLDHGHLVIKEGDAEIEDIRFRLFFPALPSVRTAPMQQFSIGTIRMKKWVATDILAWFAIESPESLFIEKISGNWSGGRVFSSSFRLRKELDALDIALFCDRLELSSILSQFGLAEAGGEGKLSGRVPLIYAKGRFFVDDGFLYSTPGEKGFLKIKQSKYLETTIPADVPQFSPLHFAGAALADFEYNWAKLQIKSEGENMLFKLQVDGKPQEKLPFRFDSTNNVFVRLAPESKGGIDQPLQLDVNFNVPVNEMFQYKNTIMPFFRKLN